MMLTAVENGPVRDLPRSLVCGDCGAKSGGLMWQAFVHDDGSVVGMLGIANCSRCRCSVVGIVSNSPAFMHDMQAIAQKVLGGDS